MKTHTCWKAGIIGALGFAFAGPGAALADTSLGLAAQPLAAALACPYPNPKSSASDSAEEGRFVYAQEMETRMKALQDALTKESQHAAQELAEVQGQSASQFQTVHCYIQGLNDEIAALQGELAELKTGHAPASGTGQKLDAFGWGPAWGAAAVILFAVAALSGPLFQALRKRRRGKSSQ